jgi:hypothetical protein
VGVQITVADAAAVQDQGVIEQRAVAVRRRAQPVEEVSEQADVVRVDLGVLLDLVRRIPMMRDRVVRIGYADVVVGPRARAGRTSA